MKYYHSLGSMKAAHLDYMITNPKTFVISLLKLLELINTWGESEPKDSLKTPYLYVDTTKLKRAFIVKGNQIVSFAFPFALYTKPDPSGKEKVYINYWDIQLDDVIISYAMTVALTLDLEKSTYAAQAKDWDFTDPNRVAAAKVFEIALSLEPSYIRYDYDIKACNGSIHPLHHFDFNYSNDYTYKLGLYGNLECDDVMDIFSEEKSCWYVYPYSSMIKMGVSAKEWIRKKLVDRFAPIFHISFL